MKIIVTNSEACSMLSEKLSNNLAKNVIVEIEKDYSHVTCDTFSGADFVRFTACAIETKSKCAADNWKIPTIKAVRDASRRGTEGTAGYVVLGLCDAKRFVETLFPY